MAHRFIQVGTGGRGASWCSKQLQPALEAGRIEPVAAVDVEPDALENAQEHLGLSAERCYTDAEEAFANHEAEWCLVVTPPQFHEDGVDLALEHDMDILSEKPIADSMAASVRITEKVKAAGAKMGVTMNHRFGTLKRTLHQELHSGDHGPLNYINCHFTRDQRGEEHTFRMESDHPLLVDASIHHLDFLSGFVDADPTTVYTTSWNRSWDNHEGHTNALVQIEFENGVNVAYEGAKTNAVGLHGWGDEYIRAECRDATLLYDPSPGPDHGELEYFEYDPGTVHQGSMNGLTREDAETIPVVDRPFDWAPQYLLDQFLDWLEGGEPMETRVESNLHSMAIIFAAIESSATGEPVDIPTFLEETRSDTTW